MPISHRSEGRGSKDWNVRNIIIYWKEKSIHFKVECCQKY